MAGQARSKIKIVLAAAGVFVLLLLPMFPANGRDFVKFTLSFEDRDQPAMEQFDALCLYGPSFEDERKHMCGEKLYKWFAVPLFSNGLHYALTSSDYASKGVFVQPEKSAELEIAKRKSIEEEAKMRTLASQEWHNRDTPYGAGYFKGMDHRKLVGLWFKKQKNGEDFPWAKAEAMGEIESKRVYDAVYWDLVRARGTEEQKRKILTVYSEDIYKRRLDCGYRVPRLCFDMMKMGWVLEFHQGVEGPVFARLQVEFPRKFFSYNWSSRLKSYYEFHEPVLEFVFAELKKPNMRGKSITGVYETGAGVTTD